MHAATCDRVVLVFYWTTTDKLEFTVWFSVNRMLGCGENAILRWRRRIAPPLPPSPLCIPTPIVPRVSDGVGKGQGGSWWGKIKCALRCIMNLNIRYRKSELKWLNNSFLYQTFSTEDKRFFCIRNGKPSGQTIFETQ